MPSSLTSGRKFDTAAWLSCIRSHDPSPAGLASLDIVATLRVLRLLTTLLRRRVNLSKRLSAWLWAVLCSIPDVGTLDSEQVGVVRELGKRAVWVRCGWAGGDIAESTEGLGPGEEEEGAVAELDAIAASLVDGEEVEGEERDETDARGNSSSPLLTAATGMDESETHDMLRLDGANDTSAPRAAGNAPIATDTDTNTTETRKQYNDIDLVQASKLQRKSDPHGNDNKNSNAGANTPLHPDAVDAPEVTDPTSNITAKAGAVNSPDANTRATLDMLITVAGDLYGQRDLLEFGEVWGEEEGEWS